MGGRGRRINVPNIVDELLDRHDLAWTKKQRRQHGLLLPAAELQRAITGPGLERPQELEPDLKIVARPPS